jgi:hypothetical protein
VAIDLEELWTTRSEAPVQPRLVCAMTGADERFLQLYRAVPTHVVGWHVRHQLSDALEGKPRYEAVDQLARLAGIALWERELGVLADSIGI